MGKSKKKNKISTSFGYSQGLEDQINDGRVAKPKAKKFDKIKLRYEEEDNEYIDPKTTQRILQAAQKQRAELAKEFGPTPSEAKSKGLFDTKKNNVRFAAGSDEGSDGEDEKFDDDGREDYNENDFFDDLKINDEDEKALEMFQNK